MDTAPSPDINTDDLSDETVSIISEEEDLTGEIPVSPSETEASKIPARPTTEEINNNYPSFRGPFGQGRSHHNNIPVEWDGPSGKNILWKVEIPLKGYNSPVIWGDFLYLTGADQSSQVVYCYNRNTGQLIWQHPVTNIQRPPGNIQKPTDDTGYAAPTLTTDGRFIGAIFATGDVICLNMEGTRQWAKNLGIPDNHYGHSSSLILWRDLLLVQFDDNDAGKVLALDIISGEEKWATARKSKISWASPIIIQVRDHYELVLASSPEVAAYDPLTGRELWALECLTGEVGPSPAFSDGLVFAANEYAQLVAIRPANPPEIIWATNEYLPEVSSPVAEKGLLFLGTSYGVIACYDANNGELLWEYECDQGIYASPVIVDGKVYFLDMDGKMHIFNKAADLSLIGEPQLGESTVSTPAFANGRIYLRGLDYLYCIGKK
jgi:outer membrane protein assembly factor BamB